MGASATKSVKRFSVRPCDQTETLPKARIDKWLFHARFYRTRPLAQAAAGAGKVRLNGTRVEKPSQAVRPGDILTLGKGGEILTLRVLALAERRGPAPEARQLYEIVAD
jgi:ribosome-associated heat shock protein Hsp15